MAQEHPTFLRFFLVFSNYFSDPQQVIICVPVILLLLFTSSKKYQQICLNKGVIFL